VLLEVSVTNNTTIYEFATMDYDEEVQQEVNSRGNLFCDKDSFEILLKEVHKGFQN